MPQQHPVGQGAEWLEPLRLSLPCDLDRMENDEVRVSNVIRIRVDPPNFSSSRSGSHKTISESFIDMKKKYRNLN